MQSAAHLTLRMLRLCFKVLPKVYVLQHGLLLHINCAELLLLVEHELLLVLVQPLPFVRPAVRRVMMHARFLLVFVLLPGRR
jgi:hypothetical protein